MEALYGMHRRLFTGHHCPKGQGLGSSRVAWGNQLRVMASERHDWHAQVGDYGLGYCANSLELGCDCLGTIKYFDADMIDSKGAPLASSTQHFVPLLSHTI